MDPVRLLVAFELGAVDEVALIDWAVASLGEEGFGAHGEVAEMARLNPRRRESREEAGPLFRSLLRRLDPAFEIRGAGAEEVAKEILAETCQALLDGRARPYDLCKLVGPIENLYDFPGWLGDLYNACDWVEPSTPIDCAPALPDEVKRFLASRVE
jgi:hypothetical protein